MRYGMKALLEKEFECTDERKAEENNKKRIFFEKTSLKIWWNQKIVVPLHPLMKTKL